MPDVDAPASQNFLFCISLFPGIGFVLLRHFIVVLTSYVWPSEDALAILETVICSCCKVNGVVLYLKKRNRQDIICLPAPVSVF